MRHESGTKLSRENRLFYGLIVVHLLPIWLFEYFPTQDGPAHLYNARIIGEWFWSDFPVFRDYMMLNERFDPTWFTHLILAGLMKVFSPALSQKLFLTVYIVTFPLAIRYALTAAGQQARFLAVLGFPLIYCAVFHYGFFSFSISLAVYCLFVGYWLRRADSLPWSGVALLVLLSTLLYFTHVITMAMAYGSVAVISGTWWLAEMIARQREKQLDGRSLVATTWQLLVKPVLPLLPALTLLLVFVSDRERIWRPGPGFLDRLRDFLCLGELYVFQPRELILSSILAALLWGLTGWFIRQAWTRRYLHRSDALLLLVPALTIVYFLAPDPAIGGESGVMGGGFIKGRLNLLPFLVLLFWLGSRAFSAAQRRGVELAGASIAVAFLGMHAVHYVAFNRQIQEYLTAVDRVVPGSTLLPLVAGRGGIAPDGGRLSLKVDPLVHTSNLAGAERPLLVLLNYEAELGYFPVRFQPSRNPYLAIGDLERGPPQVVFHGYEAATGGQIDYVLVWLGQKRNHASPEMRSVYAQLEQGFRLVFTSENGRAELFQRNPPIP